MMNSVAVIGVPSSAGAHNLGLEQGPQHFRRAGLTELLQSSGMEVLDLGDLPMSLYRPDKGNPKQRNLARVVETAKRVADQVDVAFQRRARPIVIGGDCTITVGVLAGALKHISELGLLYLDGHTDLNTPATSRSGILDSMGMAHSIGLGADELCHIGPRYPLMPQEKVVLFGFHPDKIYPGEHDLLKKGAMLPYPVTEIVGKHKDAAAVAAAKLEQRAAFFAVHFDVDAITFVDFPVADVPQYHGYGLSLQEAMDCLAVFVSSSKFGGLVITEFNPDRDFGGRLVDRFTRDVVKTLAEGCTSWAEIRSG